MSEEKEDDFGQGLPYFVRSSLLRELYTDEGSPRPPSDFAASPLTRISSSGRQMAFSYWLQLAEFGTPTHPAPLDKGVAHVPRKIICDESTSRRVLYACSSCDPKGSCDYTVHFSKHKDGKWKVIKVKPHTCPPPASCVIPTRKELAYLCHPQARHVKAASPEQLETFRKMIGKDPYFDVLSLRVLCILMFSFSARICFTTFRVLP
mgnify:CR=1 FL=1|jgi:hypothetical protein